MIEVLIEQEHYEEALMLLDKESIEEPNYYRLVCYYALGRYPEACMAGKKAMNETSTRYYEIVALYLAALVADQQDDEALRVVEAELHVPYIPPLYEETFERTKKQILQRKKQLPEGTTAFDMLTDDEIRVILQQERQPESLLLAIAQLHRRNIRSFFKDIQSLLLDPQVVRYIKTILFELLADQGVQEVFEMITKDGQHFEVSPVSLPPSLQPDLHDDLLHRMGHIGIDQSPMMNEYADQLLAMYFANQYPIEIAEEEYDYLAAAVFAAASTLLNQECDLADLSKKMHLKEPLLFAYYEQVLALS